MQKFVFILLVSLFINNLDFVVYSLDHPDVGPTTFCYDEPKCGPKTWGGLCRNGRRQSPIDIPLSSDSTINYTSTKFFMNCHYTSPCDHPFFAQNNGHTAQFELNPNTSALHSNLMISGGELSGTYRFAQLHFHWGEVDSVGSEHSINNKRFPMEAHIVHYKATYDSLADALRSTNDREAVAVMAIFFQIGEMNKHLNTYIRTLQSIRKPGIVKEYNMRIGLLNLYPDTLEFARYRGSLTTPTCDQKVVWTVFLNPLQISEGQINAFRRLSNQGGNSASNFRPIQPRNERPIKFFLALE